MPFEDEIICDEVALKTDGYSAAELVAICQRAGMLELEKSIHSKQVKSVFSFIR